MIRQYIFSPMQEIIPSYFNIAQNYFSVFLKLFVLKSTIDSLHEEHKL